MKMTGSRKLTQQLKNLPAAQRRHISKMMEKSGAQGVRVAKTLVPRDQGDLAETIDYKVGADGMWAEITAGDSTRDGQIKAHTVEGGRDAATRGGAQAAQPYIGTARSYLAKTFKARIKRAINKAAKEVTRG